jgi:hypothetical protein
MWSFPFAFSITQAQEVARGGFSFSKPAKTPRARLGFNSNRLMTTFENCVGEQAARVVWCRTEALLRMVGS